MKKDWEQHARTVLLSMLVLIMTVGVGMLTSSFNKMSDKLIQMDDKLDSFTITAIINKEQIRSHNMESMEWKNRIKSLEAKQ